MYTNGKCKAAAIIAYFTPILWIVGVALRDRGDKLSAHHLNQALPIVLLELAAGAVGRIGGIIGTIADICELAIAILAIMGIVRAVKGSDKPLPYIKSIDVIN